MENDIMSLPEVEVEAVVFGGIGFGGIGTGLEPWSIFAGGAVGWGFSTYVRAMTASEIQRMVAAERAASKKAAPQSAGADAGNAMGESEQLGASSMADMGDAGGPIGLWGVANTSALAGVNPVNLTDPSSVVTYGLRFVAGVEGVLEAGVGLGFGAVTGWTGIGAVAGGAIALHGLDVAQAALRGTDTFTSEGLQAAGLSRNIANAIDMGVTGIDLIAAGRPILPYRLFGPPISGGGSGTSLLAAAVRGDLPPIPRIFSGVDDIVNASSGPVWNALSSIYGTGTKTAIVGRAASGASVFLGLTTVGFAFYNGSVGYDLYQ